MKRTTSRWMIAGVCLVTMLAGSMISRAQDAPRRGPRNRDFAAGAAGQDHGPGRPFPSDPTFDFVGSEMRMGGKTVKGAPYSATVITESVQTLGNGAKINRTTTASVYRDSEGRTRHEQTLDAIGPFSAAGKPRQMTFINDPVAGAQYVLDAENKTARKMKTWSGPRPDHHPPSSTQAKTESLGSQTIEGVAAEGTRFTLTIPAGKIGNDQPLEIVSERWYSPDLQVVILSKHTDPRMGVHTYRLTSINRAEPAKSLFDVPADYNVTEKQFGPRHGGPREMRKQNDN